MPRMRIDIENIREVAASLGYFAEHIDLAFTRAFEGDGGDALRRDMQRRMGAHVRTGKTLAAIDISRDGHDVVVGVNPGNDRSHIGTFLESGTEGHIIRPRKGGRHKALYFNGTAKKFVRHPGTPRYRIAFKSLNSTAWEVEAAVIDELNKMAWEAGLK